MKRREFLKDSAIFGGSLLVLPTYLSGKDKKILCKVRYLFPWGSEGKEFSQKDFEIFLFKNFTNYMPFLEDRMRDLREGSENAFEIIRESNLRPLGIEDSERKIVDVFSGEEGLKISRVYEKGILNQSLRQRSPNFVIRLGNYVVDFGVRQYEKGEPIVQGFKEGMNYGKTEVGRLVGIGFGETHYEHHHGQRFEAAAIVEKLPPDETGKRVQKVEMELPGLILGSKEAETSLKPYIETGLQLYKRLPL